MQWWSQSEDLELQQKMILEVMQTNANDVCKRIILGLPVDPPPTLDHLIETCTKRAIIDPKDQQKDRGSETRLHHQPPFHLNHRWLGGSHVSRVGGRDT
ncbi:hypothetical protein DUI87_02163 [Hirundo rustica rustica]|uniref:Uncharacterized protein n=1 Tax=Hirundo rustica rustica TaxID=333673 RepID=A0A3M0L6J6_HIRRU|nr:hypothetical protein DUI87_02163 [Hirundo rustica rustica]